MIELLLSSDDMAKRSAAMSFDAYARARKGDAILAKYR